MVANVFNEFLNSLTKRDWSLARSLIPGSIVSWSSDGRGPQLDPESIQELINERIRELQANILTYETAVTELEAESESISRKIGLAQNGIGFMALVYWFTLPWLRSRKNTNEANRQTLREGIQALGLEIELMRSSQEYQEEFLEAIIKSRIATFRWSVFHSLEKILGVKQFGRQRVYWEPGGERQPDKDWWLDIRNSYLCNDGYALVVAKYQWIESGPAEFGPIPYWSTTRKKRYDLYFVDLDNKYRLARSNDLNIERIEVERDEPNKIWFTAHTFDGKVWHCVIDKTECHFAWLNDKK